MRAIEEGRFGPPDVLQLREVADPKPDPGQVLATVAASEVLFVLFVDTLVRSDKGVDYFPNPAPYVPGAGVGGTVTALGEGVEPEWLVRTVMTYTGGRGRTGGYAELAVVDLEACSVMPDELDVLDATAVLHDGVTALRILGKSGVDEWILILGAAGGMGILLVHLLAARGHGSSALPEGRPKGRHLGRRCGGGLLNAVLDEVRAGARAPLVGQTFSLVEATKAHLAIEARDTVAKTLLIGRGDLSSRPSILPA